MAVKISTRLLDRHEPATAVAILVAAEVEAEHAWAYDISIDWGGGYMDFLQEFSVFHWLALALCVPVVCLNIFLVVISKTYTQKRSSLGGYVNPNSAAMLSFTIVFSLLSCLFLIIAEVKRVELQNETLESKIHILTTSLAKSSAIITDIETQIQARTALVNKLQEDAKVSSQLASVNREQAEAIAQTLRLTLQDDDWYPTPKDFILLIAGFILGMLGQFLLVRKLRQIED